MIAIAIIFYPLSAHVIGFSGRAEGDGVCENLGHVDDISLINNTSTGGR